MKAVSKLRFAGDVSIDKIKIVSQSGFAQDIAAQVINIQIYEDLFSPFMSGSLIVKDSLDLVNLMPFIGEEFLELDISTPTLKKSKNIKGSFYIYKLSNREIIGDRSVVYQLHFVSKEAIVDVNKKISRVFANKISDLVEPFIKDKTFGLESDKQVFVEPTINNFKYISNFWSPVKNIMYLVDNAANMNKTPNYVFFENRDGFYFISLESLYGADPYQEFTYDKYVRDSLPQGGDVRNIPEDFKRIKEINIPVGFDYMDRISSGMLSSKILSYDVTTKKYATKNYDMFKRFEEQKHLNNFPINSNKAIFKSNSFLINYPKYYANFNGFGDVTNHKIIQERLSLTKLAESNKLQITVPGRTDYTVGQKIAIVLNKMEPLTERDRDTTDKMFSGFYLIAAINHYIDREKHECIMEVIKESSQMNMDRGN
jgi:hypothetical protein